MTPLLSTPLLRAQSDRRLAALAADGHDRAFEAIVERYRRPLQRYLRRLLSEGLAEDVLQATFVRAWQALRAGTDVRDLRPWLYRIAHNQALNALRAAGSALPEVPGLAATSTELEVERREELRATLDGIEALPDRQRAALLAVAVADRPHADVARELGLSDGALRQLLLRARTALRAAATAITPYPLLTWVASGQDLGAARVAEVAAGAGGAGVAIKASAALIAAGAVVAGAPALRHDERAPAAKRASEHAAREHVAKASAPAVTRAAAQPHAVAPTAEPVAAVAAVAAPRRSHRDRSGSRHEDEHSSSSGPGPGSGSVPSSNSGPGSSDDGRGATESRDSDDKGGEVSHEGSSGKGSPSSGKGSSGSGSSGSGEAPSGSSGGPGPSAAPTLVPSTDDPVTTTTDDHGGEDPSGTDGGSGGGDDGSSSDGHSGSGG
jgi:RNA polymerase sigma factor (sigma-70 family)